MTIEIADRLVKLRKKNGYSQEELADKLGLSRQAVSKWERAEASPDTDNLICLAKLYGVSLDELLSTDEDVDTIVEEQVKKEEEPKEETPKEEEVKEEPKEDVKESVHIGKDGIHITDDDGSQVIIDGEGIRTIKKDGTAKKRKHFETDKVIMVSNILEGILFLVATVAYILLGALLGMWWNAWVVFFIPEILVSIIRAIRKKNANHFNITFLAIFTYFFVCMVYPGLEANLWHPMWVVVFAIPIYHTTVSLFNKALGKSEDDEDDEDKDDEDVIDVEVDK